MTYKFKIRAFEFSPPTFCLVRQLAPISRRERRTRIRGPGLGPAVAVVLTGVWRPAAPAWPAARLRLPANDVSRGSELANYDEEPSKEKGFQGELVGGGPRMWSKRRGEKIDNARERLIYV